MTMSNRLIKSGIKARLTRNPFVTHLTPTPSHQNEVVVGQDDPFVLYQCRCGKAKQNDNVICYAHSLAVRLPASPH